MPNSRAFVLHVLETMRPTASVSARAMFGGHGLYVDGRMFALIAGDELYLKTDATNRPEFEGLGLGPFVYAKRGGEQAVMSYHHAPEEALESPEAMRDWLRSALGASLRAAAGKPTGGPARSRTRPVSR
jgi:DNA transformation protein and related proteins